MTGPDDRQGAAGWIDAVLAEHEGPLLRYAARLTGDLERARDIVQDTFLKLCQAERNEVESHLAQWLFTVCRNRALDVNRKEHRMKVTDNGQLDAPEAPGRGVLCRVDEGGESQATREHRTGVLAALDGLPERQQEIVRLKFQNGMSYQQIAAVMELSVSNVGFILHTALKTLREKLAAAESQSSPSGSAHS